MAVPAVAAALLVFSALWSCQATSCVSPQPGKCSRDTRSATNNATVCGLDAGNCRFTNKTGLCSYRQGCADPDMSNWTASQDGAEARQERTGSCNENNYYSVLESPWLNFSHVSCLKFAYLRHSPAALDVFLYRRNGDVLPLLNRSPNTQDGERNYIRRTINPGTGKVLFRAYGGGSGKDSVVKVFKVSVEPGNCTWSGELLPHPSTSSGEGSVDCKKQNVSPLISPTVISQDRTDCLRFQYRTQPSTFQLTVSIQLHLEEQSSAVVWNYTRSESPSAVLSGSCPIQVNASFKIIFTECSSSSGGKVNVSDITFRRGRRKEECRPSPLDTNTSATDTVISSSHTVTPPASGQCGPFPPSSTTTEQTSTKGSGLTTSRPLMTSTADPVMTSTSPVMTSTRPVIIPTTSHTPDHSLDSGMGGLNDDEGNDDFNATVLPAIVAAIVVVIIIVVVAVVLLIRRRRLSKKDQSESPTPGQEKNHAPKGSQTRDNRRDSYSEIRASHFDPAIPVEDSGYFESDDAAACSPDPDIDPYERIHGDMPADTQDPEDDDYSHINATGFPDGVVPPEIAEDDYHHINTPQSTSRAPESAVYTQVQKKGKPAERPAMGYAYTQVNKKGKKMSVEGTPDPGNANGKKAHKPAVAPKPGHSKGDGNTASSTQMQRSKLDDENLEDGVSDPYNRIHTSATPHHGASSVDKRPDPDADTYNRIVMASDSGQRGPSPNVDVEDDYNSLDFDHAAPAQEKATGSYDHVCSNPDDDYSRADGGKKLVVMDSSYDRVRFADA